MRKAGGIIALIAGIFAVFAAGFTLFTGGLGAAFEAEGADTIVLLGWGGVVFAFLTIVLGAVAHRSQGENSRHPHRPVRRRRGHLGRNAGRHLHGAGGDRGVAGGDSRTRCSEIIGVNPTSCALSDRWTTRC